LFHEKVNAREAVGIVLAVAAAVALSYEGNSKSEIDRSKP